MQRFQTILHPAANVRVIAPQSSPAPAHMIALQPSLSEKITRVQRGPEAVSLRQDFEKFAGASRLEGLLQDSRTSLGSSW